MRVEVVAYFADDPTRVYQLAQWLPVLQRLDQTHRVEIVTRQDAAAAELRARTDLPVRVAPSLSDLSDLYGSLEPKVALYCNNSRLNFDSLVNARMLHVHIGHGESDKQSMTSNNAKAYDRVFVAGEAAVRRHTRGLLEFDADRLVRIGRPQLDLEVAPLLPESTRVTVLYAPTWEGDADYNDYTSVDVLGPAIVRAVLALPHVRLVYKPHPKITTSTTPAVRDGHQAILAALARAADRDPLAGHTAVTVGDILAVMPVCDVMVTDVSSVGLDWLYLHTERPILLTDRHGDRERMRREVALSHCADVVDAGTLAGLPDLILARLAHDEWHAARASVRQHYFDDRSVGDSTARFLAAVSALVAHRDQLLEAPPVGVAADRAV